MSFMTNQIIRKSKKWKVYIYIYIYIYSYLKICEYFNNLNEDGDMAGTGIMAGICTSPYPIEKSGIPHTQSIWGFPVKTGTGSGNTHGDGFICHL